jgi:Sulfotransferase family
MTHPDASAVELIMLSSGFENGGNVTHRFFDGHPELFVYPFESQLGTRFTNDFLSSIERFQYRYPEFPMHGTPEEDYEAFFDEELKTLLRTRRSKFQDAGVVMDEAERRRRFVEIASSRPRTRGNIVAAFFQATFDAWINYARSGRNRVYVGYSPAIGMDGDRILADFPRGHVLHVVRNVFSAYADTKKRPFPLPLRRYVITWNLYHHIALMHHHRHPDRYHLLRYEDLVADPRAALEPLCAKLGIGFADTMTYPSFNGRDISDRIYPWGTIVHATPAANVATMNELPDDEFDEIRALSTEMLRVFRYEDLLGQRA